MPPQTLDALRAAGWAGPACTKKPAAAIRTLLDGLGLLPRFDGIGAGDSLPVSKPDPRHLTLTLQAADLSQSPAVKWATTATTSSRPGRAPVACWSAPLAGTTAPSPWPEGADAIADRCPDLATIAPRLLLSARGIALAAPWV